MIQRIQSIYLFLTTVLSFLFLKGGIIIFINGTGDTLKLTFSGIVKLSGDNASELIYKSLPVAILIIAIAVLSLITIFLFKKRNIQIMLTGLLIGFISALIIACGYYSWLIITKQNSELVPGIRMVLPVVMLILAILAYRGIKKDDQLVKSYDRLR
jgi:glucan phosphoethanolaminetransferase (alkaline phosphatase superfamily)